ncbi:ribonuclease J [Erysipelothrix sp. HDW6C]|uniref:ribonuclease J n=1 Tax=Erysipelothrix sp. HDW6C TaxID=2714930 RepID=UPI00140AC6BE|nr:ribonuclease J [Erysipelothrix sp. HDW6C]QIK69996.1 ribonuclease J [Erysipelothrix sp. HDW6C]
MEKIRFLALGGLDEEGKNLSIIEIDDEIYVIEAGIKYPRTEQLGVEIVIPDMSYLKKNKKRVKAVFITQGHDDVMGALPYLIREVNAPIYTTPLIALMIEDMLKENRIKNATIFRIKRDSRFKIDSRQCISFGVTHSIPDSFGIAIDTDQGYIVHASEFMIDFNIQSRGFTTDVANISEIGKKGVFLLTAESVYAKREGFTSPNHRVGRRLERAFEATDNRILVTLYEQNIFRLIEVIEMAQKFGRKVYFYGDTQRRLLTHLDKLNYFRMPKGLEVKHADFKNDAEKIVVIVSDVGPNVFRKMARIAMGEDQIIDIRETDSVIVASPEVPGTEAEAGLMVNELYKDGVAVTSMSYKEVFAMHASIEDLKMMISLLKPKYYVPVKGDYQNLVANASVAIDMGISAANIVILDNGQVAEFQDGRLKSTSEIIKLEDVLIDGKDHLDTSGLVLRDRQILATDGAIIVGVVINNRTKEVLGGPDIQSRGVIYLKDADNIMKEVGTLLENTISKLVKEKKYSNIDARNDARDLISKYIFKQTGKRPMILPVIIEIHV